jgi:hypothetical protein
MTTYRTPDVYIEEISVFPPSVAEVGTAIPAFIGYTEKITRLQHQDLLLKPTLITSFAEFEELFGRPHDPEISVQVTTLQPDGKDGKVVGYEATVTPPVTTYALYYAVRMFFDNGGARCYVVSTGVYGEKPGLDLIKGIEVIQLEDEPTLIVVPDAVYLTESDYTTIVETVLKQCGLLRERFGIFDIQMGDLTRLKPDHPLRGASLTTVRGHFPMQNLKYGAAYYPYLKTSFNHYIREDETNVKVTLDSVSGELAKLKSPPDVSAGAEANAIDAAKQRLGAYNFVKAELKKYFVIVPAERGGGGRVRVDRRDARGVEGAGQRQHRRRDRAAGEGRQPRAGGLQRRPELRQVDQRHPRVRRQGHPRVGRAHPRRERQ